MLHLRETVTEHYSVLVLPSQRRQAVLHRLTTVGEVGFAELAEEFSVSEMTIRRDVETLEGEGLARRVVRAAVRGPRDDGGAGEGGHRDGGGPAGQRRGHHHHRRRHHHP